MAKILIVDDEKPIRSAIREILEFEKHDIEECENGVDALKRIRENEYDILLCDVKMPKMNGEELMEKVNEINYPSSFIVMSAHGNIDTAVSFMKKGAFDYLPKPFSMDKLLSTIKNAIERNTIVVEKKKAGIKSKSIVQIIGQSEAIKNILKITEKIASSDSKVFITGPNGSGKELIAKRIHQLSYRSSFPFVEVNCAAIPSELIESELFGHEKGSFTGAVAQKKGKFEQAEGGTIFLDEIGDMSLSAQAKVLRALQENKISRVGGEKDISVNVRVIAATNKNLKEEIKKGNFREDLYHRLNVIHITVPTLNERTDDIPLLVEYFSKLMSEELKITYKKFDTSAIKELQKINWTGNVRQLKNIIERIYVLSDSDIIKVNHIEEFTNELEQY